MNRNFRARFSSNSQRQSIGQREWDRREDMDYRERMQALRRGHRVSVVFFAAFMVSIGIYVVAIAILKTKFQDSQGVLESHSFTWIRYVFYVLGPAQIFVIRLIRQIMIRGSTIPDSKALATRLSKMTILTGAFCEAPAVFGLVLFSLIGDLKDFYVLTATSFVLFFLYFPRYSDWEEWTALGPGNET
jgi:F0F1-type ATP synthase membrane subunit c/vacuolar-type H+-ATPase subunit K